MRAACIAAALLLALAGPAAATDAVPHAGHAPMRQTAQGNATQHVHPMPMSEPTAAPKAAPKAASAAATSVAAQVAAGQNGGQNGDSAVGVDERLGAQADLDVTLLSEDGRPVRLADLVDMPTILAPVYYSCPNECNVLLGTLATVLPQVGLRPGVDYRVLAVSFDELDTPQAAARRKAGFFNTIPRLKGGEFPPDAWRFLTGSPAEVRRLMDSVGYHYVRVGDAFRHTIALVALSPTGKITRYLYGIRPLAFDIAMAATEAAEGKTGLSVKRAVALCYTYDPQGRRYVFDFMKVAGAGVLAAIALFGVFLALGGKKRRPPQA
jgi:protein SCO1/2